MIWGYRYFWKHPFQPRKIWSPNLIISPNSYEHKKSLSCHHLDRMWRDRKSKADFHSKGAYLIEIDTMNIEQSLCEKKWIFSFAYLQFWILMVCNIYIVDGHVHHTSWLKTWCFVFYPIIFAKRFLPRNFPLSPPHHRHHHHPPVVAKCEQGVLILSYPWWTNSPLSVSIGMNNIAIWPSDKKSDIRFR